MSYPLISAAVIRSSMNVKYRERSKSRPNPHHHWHEARSTFLISIVHNAKGLLSASSNCSLLMLLKSKTHPSKKIRLTLFHDSWIGQHPPSDRKELHWAAGKKRFIKAERMNKRKYWQRMTYFRQGCLYKGNGRGFSVNYLLVLTRELQVGWLKVKLLVGRGKESEPQLG